MNASDTRATITEEEGMTAQIRHVAIATVTLLALAGCSTRQSSLLMERQSTGPLEAEERSAQQAYWTLEPPTHTMMTEGQIEITAHHATPEYLLELFSEKKIFGGHAGINPYFSEQMVFHVKFSNNSSKKIRINPLNFVLVDDHRNQFEPLSADYAQVLAESKRPVHTLTRGAIEGARPGYFGFSLPVGQIIGKDIRRFALLKMANLEAADLYPGVTYDGLIAFWNPHPDSKKLTLILANIKTAWEPNDEPAASIDAVFPFGAERKQK